MTIHFADDDITLHRGRALTIARQLPDRSVQTIITSPPYYGLRDYKRAGQYGIEPSLRLYIRHLVQLMGELHRVLADDGTLWLNLADCYAGRANGGRAYELHRENIHNPGVMPPRQNTTGDAPFKNLLLAPSKTAIALQRAGWILRNDIIWHKERAKPESVKDRMSQTYEHFFLFSKKPRYRFDLDALRRRRSRTDPGRGTFGLPDPLFPIDASMVEPVLDEELLPNPGDVWSIPVMPFAGAHFAVMPPELAKRAVLAGSHVGDTVLDPFSGTGTTGMVAKELGRKYVGIDLNGDYLDLSLRTRFARVSG